MSKIEADINAVIDQAASRIVESAIWKLKGFKELDEHVDHLTRQVFELENKLKDREPTIGNDALDTLDERVDTLTGEVQKLRKRLEVVESDSAPPQKAECKCGERITALVDVLTGDIQKINNRFDNLRVLAADSAELTNMSIRLDRLSHEVIELRGIKQDPASLVKRLEAVEENAIYLERIINQVKCILIIAAAKIQKEL